MNILFVSIKHENLYHAQVISKTLNFIMNISKQLVEGEIAVLVKALVTKLDDLSSVSGGHMLEDENRLQYVFLR